MTSRVGAKGQVVIPKELRDRLGIQPGDRMDFWLDGDHVAGQKSGAATPLRGRFRGRSLTTDLAAERARERIAEDER
ncbi:MAG TPA: AbrB/MazE/SpoVT family DNA-binding domain-containing protein [Actinomycetota bacterium]|jgi:AbrB family looped-hinge helix DNA binding protein|nr:AbrB/MazE/SpoVT family DNA-binding domain-containing protein [Actinomycetota bacterium]